MSEHTWQGPRRPLAAALGRVAYARLTQPPSSEWRAALSGLALFDVGGAPHVVATDGKRLALAPAGGAWGEGGPLLAPVALQARPLRKALRRSRAGVREVALTLCPGDSVTLRATLRAVASDGVADGDAYLLPYQAGYYPPVGDVLPGPDVALRAVPWHGPLPEPWPVACMRAGRLARRRWGCYEEWVESEGWAGSLDASGPDVAGVNAGFVRAALAAAGKGATVAGQGDGKALVVYGRRGDVHLVMPLASDAGGMTAPCPARDAILADLERLVLQAVRPACADSRIRADAPTGAMLGKHDLAALRRGLGALVDTALETAEWTS